MALAGIDCSDNNTHPIDWRRVKASGIAAVYVKATQGSTYVSPTFAGDVADAHAAGLAVGAYCYATPGLTTPGPQAAAFRAATAPVRAHLSLPDALDLEEAGALSWAGLAAWAQAWLAAIPGRPLIYVDGAFAGSLPGFPWGHGAWLADPGAAPVLPAGFVGLQYSWTGTVPGITGAVDLDVFDPSIVEGPMRPLIVSYQGGEWAVAADLSSRTLLKSPPNAAAWEAATGAVRVALGPEQMAAIPVAGKGLEG